MESELRRQREVINKAHGHQQTHANDVSKLSKNTLLTLVLLNHVFFPFDSWTFDPFSLPNARISTYWRVSSFLMFLVASAPVPSFKNAVARNVVAYGAFSLWPFAVYGMGTVWESGPGTLLVLSAALTALSNERLCASVRSGPGQKQSLYMVFAWVAVKLLVVAFVRHNFGPLGLSFFSPSQASAFRLLRNAHLLVVLFAAVMRTAITAFLPRHLAMLQYLHSRPDGSFHLLSTLTRRSESDITPLASYTGSEKDVIMLLEVPLIPFIAYGQAMELCMNFVYTYASPVHSSLVVGYLYMAMVPLLVYRIRHWKTTIWSVCTLIGSASLLWGSLHFPGNMTLAV